MTLAFGIQTGTEPALRDAAQLFGTLHKIALGLGWNYLSASALSAQAEAFRYLNRFPDAIAAYSEVISLTTRWGLPKPAADGKYNLAIVLHEDGQLEHACSMMSEARSEYSGMGDPASAEDARASIGKWKEQVVIAAAAARDSR